jgi:SpoVK/Ycf46/Vps4 family AAA+-type ATPase
MNKPAAAPAASSDAAEPRSEFQTTVEQHIRAGYQAMYVATSEEARAEEELARLAKDIGFQFVTWDVTDGFSTLPEIKGKMDYKAPPIALKLLLDDSLKDVTDKDKKIIKHDKILFVFRDLDDFTHDHVVRRTIRSLTEHNKLVNKRLKWPIILLSPKLNIHEKLKTVMTVIDFKLPDDNRLTAAVDFVLGSIEKRQTPGSNPVGCSTELKEQLVSNLRGLTGTEAENVLSRCIVVHREFKPEMVTMIKDEKANIIKKGEVLTYIPDQGAATREEIGGFDQYLAWLSRRKLSYSKVARQHNIDYPKGVVLLGIPGTGKSMVAKATARLMGLPCYIMDVGAVFGHLVGESEQRMRDAISQVEAQRGCVLLVDEADKAFGGAADAQGDSGVTKRVFGKFLSWLAEKQDQTLVIMTLNRTAGLPVELLRAGRFDAIFYTDLPNDDERLQIMQIHLRKRGVDPASMQLSKGEWKTLVTKTTGYVGAELEEVIRESRYLSFESRGTGVPNLEDMMTAITSVVPLTVRDPEAMAKIREFCKDQGKPVTTPKIPGVSQSASAAGGRSRSVDIGEN